jgi:long-chain acyl-CoA synthetase
LQSRGLQKGARVALMMPNVLQYPVALMASLRAGYTVVNINPLYTPRELEHQLKDSGAEAIVILENFASTLQAVIAKTSVKHVVVATMGDMLGFKGFIVNFVVRRVRKMVPAWSLPGHVSFKEALKSGATRTFKPAKVSPDDIAFLQYTGGTTGVSKGATLLHRNILANIAQNAAWVESAYIKKPRPANLVYVCALPLYHVYALTVNALMGMQQGAQNILIPNPRDIPGFVKELGKYKVNVFPGLNTLFNALLNNEDFHKLDFSPMRLTFGGGMAVQKAVADRWQKLTGCIISEGYGLSETSPVATGNRFDADAFTGTIGLPVPSTEIAIRDDDGKDLPLGEVGEICIRGPQVMAGYWNRPDETAKVMTRDGFFRSGDMGFMDENGYVKIVDRKKDMILVSGFNVYPTELEDVVAQLPGVLEVAAIGIPDEKSGEVPKLFIVKKDPGLTEAAVMEYCKANLTAYKRPKVIEFRKDLPKTNVGKILRRELRG